MSLLTTLLTVPATSGDGNVVGPGSSTAHQIASYSNGTGTALENYTHITVGPNALNGGLGGLNFNISTPDESDPGNMTITAGSATSGNNAGGVAGITGGAGNGSGLGGSVLITGGQAGATGVSGGSVEITGGAGGATSGSGGQVFVIGGNGSGGNASGGNVIIGGGVPAGLGQPGIINLTNNTFLTGNLTLLTAGNKINIATGSNASAGQATLVNGTVTVNTTAVTSTSLIILTRAGIGTTGASGLGELCVGTKTASTSFVINSLQAADATALQVTDESVVNWVIIN